MDRMEANWVLMELMIMYLSLGLIMMKCQFQRGFIKMQTIPHMPMLFSVGISRIWIRNDNRGLICDFTKIPLMPLILY